MQDDFPVRPSQDRACRATRGQDDVRAAPIDCDEAVAYGEDVGAAAAPSIDVFALLAAILRRWKLITAITLFASIATFLVMHFLPVRYKSTVEILAFDPEQQIDAAVQKPISPFVDAVGFDAMNTEIKVIKSKSVALRVVRELGLENDPEFQPHSPLANLLKRWGFSHRAVTNGDPEAEKAEKLDEIADALLGKLEVFQDAYVISISLTSQKPVEAQRLAAAVADDYLTSQREARQEALQRVATSLKDHVNDLHSRVLETESSIEKLRAETGIPEAEFNNVKEQIVELNAELVKARAEVDEKRAHLEQARHVVDTNGDIESIPELTASATLTQLRQKQTELNWRVANLQHELGDRHAQVIAAQAALAGINNQLNAEAEHVLGNMKNAYDIAVQREQSLEANLQSLTARGNSETYIKLHQLEHVADADRSSYQSYLSQYNDVSERSNLQAISARIISPASFPRSPSSSRFKLYMIGAVSGVAGGFILAFLLEYFRGGIKTSAEVERSFGRPVVGIIPLVQHREFRGARYDRPSDRIGDEPLSQLPALRTGINRLVQPRKSHGAPYDQLLCRMVEEPLSQLSEAVRAMRISLELSSVDSKVVLITSALPSEGKSTAAMLLAASSASSGKKTVLLDCDLRRQSASDALQTKGRLGLSELLSGTAELMDVITEDTVTKVSVIPAGSMVPNAADLLMSGRMRDLIAELRGQFDYILMDTAPLLPVVDALVLASVADKILVIVEWGQTPRATLSGALKLLRLEARRVAGIVLNKVDVKQLSGYGYPGVYNHHPAGKYFDNT